MRSPYRVAEPQTDEERAEDIRSWKNLGLRLGYPLIRNEFWCAAVNRYDRPCDVMGVFQRADGRRYCHHHRLPGDEKL